MPPRVEVRHRARQMQNEAARRADNVHPQLEQPVPQPAHRVRAQAVRAARSRSSCMSTYAAAVSKTRNWFAEK